MKRNTLNSDLDLLCKALCKTVLGVDDYQNLSGHDLNQLSAFLIRFNPEFSSSRESLNKSLQNWFLGKNSPSPSKVEDIARSLDYADYRDFVQQNKRRIQANQWRQSASLNPFHKALLICAGVLIFALCFPMLSGLSVKEMAIEASVRNDLFLASIIQAIIVALFYLITRFADFGGRERLGQIKSKQPPEVYYSMNQFFTAWKYLWLSFSFLYTWFCFLYSSDTLYTNVYAHAFSDIVSILSSLCFAYLFSVMDVESIPRANNKASTNTFYTYLVIFTIGLSISSVLSILDRYYDLGTFDGVGTYILGYTNVIVMLYFFGRLESHYLNINRFVLLPLYTYAIIQIAYVIFFEVSKGDHSLEAYVIGMALILKGFLYFLIREWWLKEEKLERYFLKQYTRKNERSKS